MQPSKNQISEAEREELVVYMNELGLLPESQKEIEELIDAGDYRGVKAKFDFYLDLAEKKENEFYRIQQLIYKQEVAEAGSDDDSVKRQDIENIAKLSALEDAIFEEAIDRYYSSVEDEIDKINKETAEELVTAMEDAVRIAEEHVKIKEIKDKLK